jgi:hypothetical protein
MGACLLGIYIGYLSTLLCVNASVLSRRPLIQNTCGPASDQMITDGTGPDGECASRGNASRRHFSRWVPGSVCRMMRRDRLNRSRAWIRVGEDSLLWKGNAPGVCDSWIALGSQFPLLNPNSTKRRTVCVAPAARSGWNERSAILLSEMPRKSYWQCAKPLVKKLQRSVQSFKGQLAEKIDALDFFQPTDL